MSIIRYESFEQMLSYYANVIPNNIALIYGETTKKTCTFAELYRLVDERSRELVKGKKTCMGIIADGSFDCILNIFASNKAGLQVVMLDESVSTPMLQKLIGITDIDTIWGDVDLIDELGDCLTSGVKDGKDKILFFTSGTTSMSKAVTLTGYSLCQSAYNGSEKLPLRFDDTLMCMLPLSHVFGFVCGLLWGLSCGASVALGRGPRHYIDDLHFFSPTVLSAVPTLLSFLLSQNLVNDEVRLILVGAGDCPPVILESAKKLGLQVSFGYGLTETSSGVAISISGDPYAMEICPDDKITIAEDGEVLIEAPTCIMQGYYKQPEETSNVLKNNVLSTGDLGRIDLDGRLHIIGRKKEILVLPNGTKIFLPEYENKIAKYLGTYEIAAVLKDGKPSLVYHGNMGVDLVKKQVLELMKEYPRGQQISSVIRLDKEIPRTATGKIKRWELEKLVNT